MKRILKLPEVMYHLGLITDPNDRVQARRKNSTFHRRYRNNPAFPRPVATPDGLLSYWEHEIQQFLESLVCTDDPRANIQPLPDHYRQNRERHFHE
jgi:predicted DNA-binding transcriptional regulator AlpA